MEKSRPGRSAHPSYPGLANYSYVSFQSATNLLHKKHNVGSARRVTRLAGTTFSVLYKHFGSNLVPRACVTLIQRSGQRTLWKNPKPEPENPGSGLIAPA